MSVERSQFSTHEPEIAHAALDALYAPEVPIAYSGDATGFSCTMRLASAGELGADRVRHTMSVDAQMAPAPIFVAVRVVRGSFREFDSDGTPRRLRAGDVACYTRDRPIAATWADVGVRVARVSFQTIDRIAQERTGSRGPVSFDSSQPVSQGSAQAWRRLHDFIDLEMGAEEPIFADTLVAAQMAEVLAAAALVTFLNSTMTMVGGERRAVGTPASVRRAIVYIEQRAAEPITMSDIADAAGVTPRTLQYGFLRHLEITPTGYLRRVRLDGAHRELIVADPTTGATVARIAGRWGFTPGRFAVAYRAAYGRPPSETLRG